MNARDNDHITVHELRGFVGSDLQEAFNEAHALSRGTKCRQFLFSLSLSPPESANVPIDAFERAVDAVEQKVGLSGQPRAIIFHEKNGRRHAHCVWSRIDVTTMTAINLSHYKTKLREMSRSLYLEHGWKMPRGLVNSAERDPLNFTLAEWQKAKRLKHDLRTMKAAFQDAWAISDSAAAFAQALSARGYYLAQGDRRSFVAVDLQGEVFAIARWTGIKTKVVNQRLGNPDDYPSVEAISAKLTALLNDRLKILLEELQARHAGIAGSLEDARRQLVMDQRKERDGLARLHAERRTVEHAERVARLPTGLKGLWSRISGAYTKIKAINEEDARLGDTRDRQESQALIQRQVLQRRCLQNDIQRGRSSEAFELRRLHREISQCVLGGQQKEKLPPEMIERGRQRRQSMS
ncbi:relaxase/mobilization nuclease domain-containing protein [Bosea sp. (in: a-proteobacteria)]|uniref:relaxase/mobilization nuclease domain-containing protein n=1 Tax=Bosea sp. (in: a-proteobacteria) TaxID=1871050 RepID=UPI00356ACB15